MWWNSVPAGYVLRPTCTTSCFCCIIVSIIILLVIDNMITCTENLHDHFTVAFLCHDENYYYVIVVVAVTLWQSYLYKSFWSSEHSAFDFDKQNCLSLSFLCTDILFWFYCVFLHCMTHTVPF